MSIKNKFSRLYIQELLLKSVIFVFIFYIGVLSLSILIAAFLFISLDSYKGRIEKVILKRTGYELTVGNIHTKLSHYYLPEVIIDNIHLVNPSDLNQKFSVQHLEVVFSYASIWNLEPIFNRINIDGTDIDLQYLNDGSFIINGININHPDKKTIENTKNSPIDLEAWILKQEQIKLSNINLSFVDQKNGLPKLKLNNITTTLTNNAKFHKLDLKLDTPRRTESDLIITEFSWVGGKLTDFQNWDSASLKLQSYNIRNNFTGTLQQYLPNLNLLQKFNAQTALDAEIKNGKLEYFYANFDLNNLQYALKHNQALFNFPKLGGSIKINKIKDDDYSISAENLTITTPNGYLINNKNISGSYNLNKSGQINLENTNLKSFNNLLAMLPLAEGISLDGNIQLVKLNWFGPILKPVDFKLYAKFNSLAIKSKKDTIPNINGISGDINLSRESGILNLSLDNSRLIFKPVFLIPYQFKHLDSQITWQINKDKSFVVNLKHTNIQMIDFTGYASGKYIYTPGTTGYLELKAHVNKLLTSHVGDYLPVQIGKSVHEWLNQGLAGGYGENANLDLHGKLSDFPFNNNGVFYIDADINNAKLDYVKGWPTLDNLHGKFMIRNHKIIITANSGNVAGNHIESAYVVIPDMTATGAYLVADGLATGTTPNFMHYLQKTPINAIIGHLPDKITTTGTGNVKIHLKVPFDKPEKTSVNGDYSFINNDLTFTALPVPKQHDVSGALNFSDHGVTINKIQSHSLNSLIYLSANTSKTGIIHFNIDSPDLDYYNVSKEYLPYISSIINGRAKTNINFDITKSGIDNIKVDSNLENVTVDLPKPLHKSVNLKSKLDLNIFNYDNAFNINFNYADDLFGSVYLNTNGKVQNGYIGLGTNNYIKYTSNSPKFIITAAPQTIYLDLWIKQINDLLENNPANKTESTTNRPVDIRANDNSSFYPIEVLLDTQNLYVAKTNYHYANIDLLVTPKNAIFSVNNSQANGYGVFDYLSHSISLNMNDFHLYESIKDFIGKSNTSFSESIPFVVTLNNTLVSNTKLAPNDHKSTIIGMSIESKDPDVNIPTTTIDIVRFWYENQILGHLHVKLVPDSKNLIIESGSLLGSASQVYFSGTNYCMECIRQKSFVEMQSKWNINDFGKLLEHIGYVNTISKGNGIVTASFQWNGKLEDFDITHTIASINMDLKNGKFLKIDTTSGLLARVIGILNLQYLFSFGTFGFSQIFENGFYFSELKIRAYLINNKIDIKSLYIWGATATINSNGIIDIENNSINLFMSVTPHLSSSVAIGVGVATLNPLIGVATYGAEELLGSPVNKLFTFNFHITGSLQDPNIEQVEITKQVVNNVNATVGNN